MCLLQDEEKKEPPLGAVFIPNGKLLATILRIDTSKEGLIGSGSYGNVYRAVLVDTATPCAVKLPKALLQSNALRIDPQNGTLSGHLTRSSKAERAIIRDLAREIDYAVRLTLGDAAFRAGVANPNTCIPHGLWLQAMRGAFQGRWKEGYKHIHHIYEFDKEHIPCLVSCPCEGTLYDLKEALLMQQQDPSPLWFRVVQHVYLGVSYMHSQNIAHNDLKPENILMQGGQFLVSDFGLCSPADRPIAVAWGTPNYFSPELRQPQPLSLPRTNDAFAFAKTCLVILHKEKGVEGAVRDADDWIEGRVPAPAAVAPFCEICRAPQETRYSLFRAFRPTGSI